METTRWTNQIDEITQDFVRNFGALTPAQLNLQPDSETWSIARNIDHLIVINSSYFPALADLHAGRYQTPFMGKLGFMVKFFGNFILGSVEPTRKKKMKTFPVWEPGAGNFPADILQQFVQNQEELKKQIEAAKDLLERGAVISSPANRNIVYKLEAAFDIIVTHERRHLAQAKELLALM